MSKRVTIMIDDANDKKLRLLQAKQIRECAVNGCDQPPSVSFSKVINQELRKRLG